LAITYEHHSAVGVAPLVRRSPAAQCLFFFSSRRRHTRSLCDWSSDVCFPISVLLAGLIQDQKNENKSGIPLLDELQGIDRKSVGRERAEMSVVAVSLKKN